MKSEYLKRWMLYLEEIGKPAEDGTRDGKNDGKLGKPVKDTIRNRIEALEKEFKEL